jgi:hypothetical protein
MNRRFTTVGDVIAHLMRIEPAFSDELTYDQLHDIVCSTRTNRYEELTDAELHAMTTAAYRAFGVEPSASRRRTG